MVALGRFRTALWIVILAVAPARSAEILSYSQRREAVLAGLANAAAIIPGGAEQELFTFRQRNNFFYLTGIEQPDLLLLLSPLSRSKEILFLPARNLTEGSLSEAWTGAKLGPGPGTEKATGLAKASDRNLFEETLGALAGQIECLYFDYQPSTLDGPVSAEELLLQRIRQRYPHLEIRLFSQIIDPMRVVKDPSEVATLEQAIKITGQSIIETIARIKPGMYEYEVEALLGYGFRSRGSPREGFPSIVGSGPNSAVLHYNANRRRIGDGELVLMDVGAEYNYYTADITRTVPSNGRFTPRQKEIYGIVLRAQAAAIDSVRPGVTIGQVHQAARKVIEEAGFGEAFIHNTSHFLGLDVHDVGNRDVPLKPGMVITVEPGIYLKDESLGVRIEDDVLVTPDGCRVLSESIPKKIEQLESLMNQRR